MGSWAVEVVYPGQSTRYLDGRMRTTHEPYVYPTHASAIHSARRLRTSTVATSDLAAKARAALGEP